MLINKKINKFKRDLDEIVTTNTRGTNFLTGPFIIVDVLRRETLLLLAVSVFFFLIIFFVFDKTNYFIIIPHIVYRYNHETTDNKKKTMNKLLITLINCFFSLQYIPICILPTFIFCFLIFIFDNETLITKHKVYKSPEILYNHHNFTTKHFQKSQVQNNPV